MATVIMEDRRPVTVLCRVVDRVQLELFAASSESWGAPILLSSAIDVRNSAFLLLSTQYILCAGGYDSKYHTFLRTALLLSCEGSVRELTGLGVARCGIGLVEYEGRVWGFGGRDVKVGTVVERIGLEGGEWEIVREMSSARAYFNPVIHEEEAYLCGGLTPSCECFSFGTETYRSLSYQLPESSESLVTMLPTGFLILTSRHISHIPFKVGEMTTQEARIDCVKTSCGPVLLDEKLYIICEGEAWRVDLGTRQVVTIR